MPTMSSTIVIFIIFSVFFLLLGILKYYYGLKIVEFVIQYNKQCTDYSTCTLQFELTESIPGTTFVYYELQNYNQNHRRYVKSKDNN